MDNQPRQLTMHYAIEHRFLHESGALDHHTVAYFHSAAEAEKCLNALVLPHIPHRQYRIQALTGRSRIPNDQRPWR